MLKLVDRSHRHPRRHGGVGSRGSAQKSHVRRSTLQAGRGKAIAVLLTLIATASVFAASPATADGITLRAGNACAFDVSLATPDSDPQDVAPGYHHSQSITTGSITVTNLETGATYLWESRYDSTETFDRATKLTHETIIGRVLLWFAPGEVGPNGVVQEPGALLGFSGTIERTYNKKGLSTAFSYVGNYIDLCAVSD